MVYIRDIDEKIGMYEQLVEVFEEIGDKEGVEVNNAYYHYYSGVKYMEKGDMDRADEHFRNAERLFLKHNLRKEAFGSAYKSVAMYIYRDKVSNEVLKDLKNLLERYREFKGDRRYIEVEVKFYKYRALSCYKDGDLECFKEMMGKAIEYADKIDKREKYYLLGMLSDFTAKSVNNFDEKIRLFQESKKYYGKGGFIEDVYRCEALTHLIRASVMCNYGNLIEGRRIIGLVNDVGRRYGPSASWNLGSLIRFCELRSLYIKDDTYLERAEYYRHLALLNSLVGDKEGFMMNINRALKYASKHGDKRVLSRLKGFKNEHIALLYGGMKSKIKNLTKSVKWYEKGGFKEDTARVKVAMLYTRAFYKYRKGNLEEALNDIDKALEISDVTQFPNLHISSPKVLKKLRNMILKKINGKP